MTKREMNAMKMKELEDEMEEMRKHRKPSDKDDQLAVEGAAIQQSVRENEKALEVSNSNDVVTELSDAAVKTAPGGYHEVKRSQRARKTKTQGEGESR